MGGRVPRGGHQGVGYLGSRVSGVDGWVDILCLPQTTKAGGTHSTGMLSSCIFELSIFLSNTMTP